ncbi:MAG: hypothetical protein RDV41_10845 [Planctomycetota bacterium]|nr:hypothetical protein [Planctomycetota bacterium]
MFGKGLALLAALIMTFSVVGCTATQKGAAAGAVIGGGAGYIIGKNSGDGSGRRATQGALIGAAAGAVAGGLIGHEVGKVKFCPRCGSGYQEEDNYCIYDGTQLEYKR